MATIYIFEGPDRVGKSTIANWWANQLNTKVTHFGTPDPILKAEDPQYQYRSLIRPPAKLDSKIVLDRSWLSGLFYEVIRRNQQPDFKSVVDLESKLIVQGWTICYIFVHRPWTTQLLQAHVDEVTTGQGYGTLADRVYEHFAWNYFVKSFAPGSLYFPIYVLENPTLKEAYEKLATGLLPSARFHTIREQLNPSTVNSSLTDFWSKQPWAIPVN